MDKITQHHLANIANSSSVSNDDGSLSTVRTLQFDDENGGAIVVPSIWDGKKLDDRAALKRAIAEGVVERFASHEEATAFDRKIHDDNPVLGGRMVPLTPDQARGILAAHGGSMMKKYAVMSP